MTAQELMQVLNGFKEDLPENTRDRIIYGDPQREVKAIAVCWMAYAETIKQAAKAGANILISHEPTFYTDRDLENETIIDLDAVKAKQALIDELGITILRCHDAWDYFKEHGIIVNWFRKISLPATDDPEDRIFEVGPMTAQAFAEQVASYTKTVGQKTIRLYGDPQRQISSVCGWYGWKGAQGIFESGADLAITYDDDDAMKAWTGAELAHDTGYPIVVINHGVLEEAGMISLAAYLQELYPDIPISHIPQGCSYTEITA